MPATSDLVTYWFDKARILMQTGRVTRVGLVATNSIRDPGSRKVLERICEDGKIFEAWSDEQWTIEGAAVRVSLICFGSTHSAVVVRLDGATVPEVTVEACLELG